MLTITYNKQRFKFNLSRFLENALTITILVGLCIGFIDLCLHTEKYSTTFKYQLENDVAKGNVQAIEYYRGEYYN